MKLPWVGIGFLPLTNSEWEERWGVGNLGGTQLPADSQPPALWPEMMLSWFHTQLFFGFKWGPVTRLRNLINLVLWETRCCTLQFTVGSTEPLCVCVCASEYVLLLQTNPSVPHAGRLVPVIAP